VKGKEGEESGELGIVWGWRQIVEVNVWLRLGNIDRLFSDWLKTRDLNNLFQP